MKLHIGCGKRILRGWVNLDLERPPKGTKPFNALKPWRFKTDSVDVVYCEDLFEHFTQPQQYLFLAEAVRVLKPGGFLRINCPGAKWSLGHWTFNGDVKTQGSRAIKFTEPYGRGHHFLPTISYMMDILPYFGFSLVYPCRKDESKIPDFPGDSRPLPNTPVRVRGPFGNIIMEAVK